MSELARLQIRIEADVAAMRRAMETAGQTVDRFENRSGRSLSNFDRSLQRAQRSALRFAGLIAAAMSVREAGQMADQWTNLTNQLRQYEDVLGPVTEASDRFIETTMNARAPVEGMSQIMQAASRSARQLGRDGDDVFAFMEAVGMGAAIANTGVAAVDGAMTQLGQAISSPRVQLQEFNSVVEGTPRLAQAFADGIDEAGGSVATLRQLISSGDISGGELFSALLDQLPTLREEFGQTQMTIGQAWQNVRTATLQAVGGMDSAAGASDRVAQSIDGLATVIRENREELAEFAGLMGDLAGLMVQGAAGVGRMSSWVRETFAQRQNSPQTVSQIRQEMERIIALSAEYEQRMNSAQGRGPIASGQFVPGRTEMDRSGTGRRSIINMGQLRGAIGQDELDRIDADLDITGPEAAERIVAALNVRLGELAARLRDLRSGSGGGGGGGGGGGDAIADAVFEELNKAKLDAIAEYEDLGARLEELFSELDEGRREAFEVTQRQLQADLEIAQARGDGRLAEALQRELALRQAIADLTADGVDPEKATVIATEAQAALIDATRQGEFREGFRTAFSEGLLAALQGDEEAFARWVRDGATRGLERALDRLADRLFDIFSNLNFGGGGKGGGWLSGLIGSIFGGGGGGFKPAGAPMTAGAVPLTAAVPGMVAAMPATSSAVTVVNYTPYIDARGATPDAVEGLRAEMRDQEARVRAYADGAGLRGASRVNREQARRGIGPQGVATF